MSRSEGSLRRALSYALVPLRSRRVVALTLWSVPEVLPAAFSGVVVARAVDDGFLDGRPLRGVAWLGALVVASLVGAVGARQVFRCLGGIVEPFRDDLVKRVVAGALHRGVTGRRDDGSLARLTRQNEIVRDTYAGLIVAVRGFVATSIGVGVGLLSISPYVLGLVLPVFLLGLGLFVATLPAAASRYRAAVLRDEELSTESRSVLEGVRDLVACGGERHGAALVDGPIRAQAAAELGLARIAAARTVCFAIGGWLPLVVILAFGPWLVARGLTAGAIMGGLTYVLFGLQPALQTLVAALGGSGLRFAVTLQRILDASAVPPASQSPRCRPVGHEVALRSVSFAYGIEARPVLDGFTLDVRPGDHLAVVGPSGIGKSTLANLISGLLEPTSGKVLVGGVSASVVAPEARVLIPQEAYVFTGSLWENATYLRPNATLFDLRRAVSEVGADDLVRRLGGYWADLDPDRLSAGERQLVALVRAYLSPAELVILDEATCHLDPVAERRAEEAFARRGGSLVVIAHRISSALRAERILVLDGTSALVGDHLTLLRKSPLYRELHGHWSAPETSGILTLRA